MNRDLGDVGVARQARQSLSIIPSGCQFPERPVGTFFSAHAKLRVKLNLGVSEVLAEKKCPRINLGIS